MNIMFLKEFILNTTGYDYKMNGLLETTIMVYRNCPVVWNYMDDVFKIMEHSMNCQDANDQCYSTYILYNYINKLNVCFHNPSLYRGTLSKYMTRCKHGSNEVEYNDHVTDIWKSKRTIEMFDKTFILPTINFKY